MNRSRCAVAVALIGVLAGCSQRSPARHNPIEDPIHEAEAGDIDAQFEVGVRVADSPGGAADYGQAARWFRRAADRGHPGAQAALGVMYHRAQGLPHDDVEAIKWLTLAASQTSAEHDAFALWREWVSRHMSPDDVAKGHALARTWTKAP